MSRRARLVAATLAALVISLLGGVTVLLFSGSSQPQQPAALQPVPAKAPEPAPAPEAATAAPAPDTGSLGSDLYGSLTSPQSDTGSSAGGTDASALLNQGALPSGASASRGPVSGGSAVTLPPMPVFQFPAPPQLPALPTIDWQAALQPYIQSQIDSAAANLANSITSTAVGSASGAFNSAAVAVGDLLLYVQYANNNNPSVMADLQNAVPAAVPAISALQAGVLPDFSGLSAAFATAAGQPPVGVPAPPDWPQFPALPELPQLPPPPDGMPTPEQVAAALAIPAVGLPALVLPELPPPPPIGLPPIGLPSFGLPSFEPPSITRLLGLPF